jgi:GH24 family phage-related lysozyme (muramidase)
MAKIRAELDQWENISKWMYLDPNGYVTVGIGTRLENISEAQGIPFHLESDGGALATSGQIAEAYAAISAAVYGQAYTYDFYDPNRLPGYTAPALYITRSTAEKLRDEHILGDYKALKEIYSDLARRPYGQGTVSGDFDSFPEKVKIALFDIIYNVGRDGLKKFRRMNDYIVHGNWFMAARESHRAPPVPEARNIGVRNLFLEAACFYQNF